MHYFVSDEVSTLNYGYRNVYTIVYTLFFVCLGNTNYVKLEYVAFIQLKRFTDRLRNSHLSILSHFYGRYHDVINTDSILYNHSHCE